MNLQHPNYSGNFMLLILETRELRLKEITCPRFQVARLELEPKFLLFCVHHIILQMVKISVIFLSSDLIDLCFPL